MTEPEEDMDLDAALQLLGVDASSNLRTAKRAYLRQVKKHPPEIDPEGFRRVRQAWELVLATLEAVQNTGLPAGELARETAPAGPASYRQAARPLQQYCDRSKALEDQINATLRPIVETGRQDEQIHLETPDLAALHEAYLEVWREASQAHPGEFEPYSRLYAGQGPEEALTTARAAATAGHFALLERAVLDSPGLLTAEELDATAERARTNEHVHLLQTVAAAYLLNDRPESAARLLAVVLERCTEPAELNPDPLLRAILMLLARNDVLGARLLHRALTDWLEVHKAEQALLRQSRLLYWVVISELLTLAEHQLPEPLQSGLASALLVRDDDQAWKVKLRRDHQLDLAVDRLDMPARVLAWPKIQEHAPTLADWFGDTLSSASASRYDVVEFGAPADSRGRFNFMWAGFAAACLVAVAGFIATSGEDTNPTSQSTFFTSQGNSPRSTLTYHADHQLDFGEVNFSKDSWEHRVLVEAIVELGREQPNLRRTARVFVSTLAGGRCDDAKKSLDVLIDLADDRSKLAPMISGHQKYCRVDGEN